MVSQKQNNNSGRTLLETLSVLVVIAILLLAILLGYNYVRNRWKRQETIKTVTELAVRYRANPIRPKKDSRIPIKTIYPVPESMRVGDVLKASDKEGATIYLEAGEDTSVFSVFSKDIMPLTCQELLESGNYESFVDSDSQICTSKEHKGRIISKKSFDKKSPEKRRELIEKICHSEHICVHLVYGQTCQDGGHYYDHECHNCESGRFEDVYGKCCEAINACGVCACPNGDVCKEETQECVECTKNADCKDPSKPRCDENTNTCVECKENKDCKGKGADYKCDLSTHTCTECKEGHGVAWNADLGICDCITRLSAGATCSPDTNCCKLGLSCMDFGESGYKCAECQEHPDCKNPDYPVCKGNTCQRCPKTPTKEGDECYAVCEACPVDIGLTCGNGNKCICNGEDNFKHWHSGRKLCVQCLNNSHCEDDAPWCDTSDNTCKKCNSNYGAGGTFECPSNLPWCDNGTCKTCAEDNNKKWHETLKMCTECTEDSHCGSGKYCSNNGSCADCLVNTWCGGCNAVDTTKPFWNGSGCVNCLANYGTGQVGACPMETLPACNEYMCKTCEAADASKPYWNNTLHECVECTEDSHCGSGKYCSNNGSCADCLVNTWCGGCNAVDATKPYWNGSGCVSCLANYGTGQVGACETPENPICNADYICAACPSETPYFYNGLCYRCEDLPSNQLNIKTTEIVNGAMNGVYTVVDWSTFPVDAKLKIESLCIDDYLVLYFNGNELWSQMQKIWYAYNVYCIPSVTPIKAEYTIPANTPFKLKAHDAGVGNVDWIGTMKIEAICP